MSPAESPSPIMRLHLFTPAAWQGLGVTAPILPCFFDTLCIFIKHIQGIITKLSPFTLLLSSLVTGQNDMEGVLAQILAFILGLQNLDHPEKTCFFIFMNKLLSNVEVEYMFCSLSFAVVDIFIFVECSFGQISEHTFLRNLSLFSGISWELVYIQT